MPTFTCRRVDPQEIDILNKIYQLRYRVYVHERQFLSAKDFMEPKESDVYDPQSVHFAVITDEGDVLGTLRMILPNGRTLPIEEKIADLKTDCSRVDYAEISRFVISKFALNRYTLTSSEDLYLAPTDRLMSKMRLMSFQMCQTAVSYSVKEGINRWYAFMERSLWRLLVNHGIRFHAIGPVVSYLGQVIPFMADVDTFHGPIAQYQQHRQIFNRDERGSHSEIILPDECVPALL